MRLKHIFERIINYIKHLMQKRDIAYNYDCCDCPYMHQDKCYMRHYECEAYEDAHK